MSSGTTRHRPVDGSGWHDPVLEELASEARAFNLEAASHLVETPPDFSTPAAAIQTRRSLHASDPGATGSTLAIEPVVTTLPGDGYGLAVRVFVPEEPVAVYLHFHMGGWVVGSAAVSDRRNSEIARNCSVAVASVEYRLAPEARPPAQLEDAELAARWLLAEAAERFGTSHLLIGGESAGATLAVLLAGQMRDRIGGLDRVLGLNLVYGVYDQSSSPSQRLGAAHQIHADVVALCYPGLDPEALRDPAISPLFGDLRDLPRALFSVGGADPLLDDTLFMHARWQAAGNGARLDIYPESPHGFEAFPTRMAAEAQKRIDAFLIQCTGPAR